jgi:ABC-type sugar transport system ATPase subunit
MTLDPGEVLALVGDNGAGKSSMVKIMTGSVRPTAGQLLICGDRVDGWSPRKARVAGIDVVYQDLALVDDISLWRNFFLGSELRRTWRALRLLRKREMMAICEKRLGEIGLGRSLSAASRAEVLSGGERQALAILRAVSFGSVGLLLDEPVASLAVTETQRVFDAIRNAKARGLGVVYVDHNMANVHTIADRIAVLSAGRVQAVFTKEGISLAELVYAVEGSHLREGSALDGSELGVAGG